jgi:hypothetical protein
MLIYPLLVAAPAEPFTETGRRGLGFGLIALPDPQVIELEQYPLLPIA